jgi:hypothetical protein
MKVLTTIIILLTLSSCSSAPQLPVVEYQYLSKSAPAEFYTLPDYPKLNVDDKTTQTDIAGWVIELEEYCRKLENKLQALHEFFEKE